MLPGFFYIRFFCDEKAPGRVDKLQWAHIIFIAVSVMALIQQIISGTVMGAIIQGCFAGLQYYFYTVVKRYAIANPSDKPV